MDSLKKYEIEALIQEELINEMDNSGKEIQTEENEYMKYKATQLVESVLKEFDMAMAAMDTKVEDPYKDVDPRIRKSQTLIRILQDNLWKLCDSQKKPYPHDEIVDDDIKALMISNTEPIVKASINKLHSLWFGEQEKPKEEVVEKPEVEIVAVGQEIMTPQHESLKIREIMGDKVLLEDKSGKGKLVELSILKKWMNK